MKRVLETWANHWRGLRAWGRPLEEIRFEIVGRNNHKTPGCGGSGSTGFAYPTLRSCVIRAGTDTVDALVTILHEYAHLATPASVGHGPSWRRRYAAAVLEVTKIPITDDGNRFEMDQAAHAAINTWWRVSGNEFATKLLKKELL